MPQQKTVTIRQHTDSLKINYNKETREFELTFNSGLDAVIPGSTNVETCLYLKEETVRQMAESLPPLDPETIH